MTNPSTNPKHSMNGNGKIHNGLDGNDEFIEALMEKCSASPGYVFSPEVIGKLASLKKEDRLAFETVRVTLKKKIGFRLAVLDELIANASNETEREPNHAEILMSFADDIELFHAEDGTAYADIEVNGHIETWHIRSEGFSHWISQRFYNETHKALNNETLKSSLANFEAKARFEGQEKSVFLRVGNLDNKIYIDLCNNEWEVIEIDCKGWRVIKNPPIRFRRAAGMKELPVPIKGGSINKLRDFLNVGSDGDFVLAVSWILAALRSQGPYPIMVLNGEMGSSKSTFSKILKSLVDPNASSIRTLPKKDSDLFISAGNAHVLAFDNISNLTNSISDSLCRLSTGGSHVARELFSNQKELTFSATKPLIANGIEEFVNRSDLADRSLFLTLESIPEDCRRTETEFWQSFEVEHPYIFAALLDGIVEGLRNINETKLPKLPRLADYALWAAACEKAYWSQGTFMSAFNSNRDDVMEHVIEADPLADTLRSFIQEQPNKEFEGTASDLLDTLKWYKDDRHIRKLRPNSLSGHLRRIATFLRKLGVEIEFTVEGRSRKRVIRIRATGDIIGSVDAETSKKYRSPLIHNDHRGISGRDSSDVTDAINANHPVLSCQLEATISIQPENLSINGHIQRADKQGWLDKIKGLFARIAR